MRGPGCYGGDVMIGFYTSDQPMRGGDLMRLHEHLSDVRSKLVPCCSELRETAPWRGPALAVPKVDGTGWTAAIPLFDPLITRCFCAGLAGGFCGIIAAGWIIAALGLAA